MSVSKCVCADITFEELKKQGKDCSLNELKKRTNCCMGCGMCELYVRLMRKTGQTNFEPMGEDTLRRRLDASK